MAGGAPLFHVLSFFVFVLAFMLTFACVMTSGASKKTCRNSRMMGRLNGHWAIKGGDAQVGELKVYWDGNRAPVYAPMKKQGSIILGIGGDNSDGATGTFYEGVMTQGYTSDATDAAVQANIVAAGYGH